MPAPEIIHQLVQQFTENRDAYRSGRYNEAQLRQEFLNPMFEALGWDMFNRSNYAPQNREVIHEDSIEIAGESRAPDYCFRLGQTRKFFVEAKKPAVDIKYDIHPAYQLRRYAWNTQLPLSILTDFEEFAVYDCRNKPNPSDSAATARVMFLKYTDYIEKWDEIAAIFSRDAIWKGSFDKYAVDTSSRRGTTEVDDAFLQEIEEWRTLLARNIALRNQQVINERQLNYAVQMTIDRIIFLRICEDRGIEPEHQLRDMSKKAGIYSQMVQLFERADIKYNSGLFHFKTEKGESNHADTFTPTLHIDDKVLKQIIKSIYYPCPYIFKEIPVEILGQVYEQFLGKVIRLTAGHQARIEEKPEVRKAGGVYYTPKYIVDYIVTNTVGKLLEGKTPTEAGQLRIVDPACGSGSFLLGAFQYLLDWHEEWYLQHDPHKWTRGKNAPLIAVEGGDWKLTSAEKKRILVNNIYGVDIDAQAVEVTKLSLLLKVLEEETGQLSLGLERVLPDLGDNIKCGNSLIGWDYFEGQLVIDEQERERVNPFDWQRAIPRVFARGGFDAVIGNPPYGAFFTEREKDYIRTKFISYKYKFESYIYFIEKGCELLRNSGYLSYITPEIWLRLDSGILLRKFLSSNGCFEYLKIYGENVFEQAVISTIVFTFIKDNSELEIKIENKDSSWFINNSEWKTSKSFVLDYKIRPEIKEIISKINNFDKLSGFGEIIQGITAYDRYRGQNPSVIKERAYHSSFKKDDTYGKWLSGKDISRYSDNWSGEWLSYGDWLGAPRSPRFFEGERLVFREIPGKNKRIQSTLLEETRYYGHSITPFKKFPTDPHNIRYFLGIANSRLISWYGALVLPNFGKDIFPKLNPKDVSEIPIKIIDFCNLHGRKQHDRLVVLVERMLELHKRSPQTPQEQDQLQREIAATDAAIDRLVYELYGLTEEEINIVEGWELSVS